MTKKQRNVLIRIIIATVLFAGFLYLQYEGILYQIKEAWIRQAVTAAIAVVIYMIAGYDVILDGAEKLFSGKVLNPSLLITAATFVSFGIGDYTEAVAAMVIFRLGKLVSDSIVSAYHASVQEAFEPPIGKVSVERNGAILEVSPEEVEIGETVIVRAGETIPLDGKILEGSSYIDEALFSGRSSLRKVRTNDEVPSGCINGHNMLIIGTTKTAADSAAQKIYRQFGEGEAEKAPMERRIGRLVTVFAVLAVLAALAMGVLPFFLLQAGRTEWVRRACAVLATASPYALLLSAGLSFGIGIGKLLKSGALVKKHAFFETLSKIRTVALEKTGVLTEGELVVEEILPNAASGVTADELLSKTAAMSLLSRHPVAAAIRKAAKDLKASVKITDYEELPELGITGRANGEVFFIGSRKLMEREGVGELMTSSGTGNLIHAVSGGQYLGAVLIGDNLKESAKEAVEDLKKNGAGSIVMLTDDNEENARKIGADVGIEEIHAGLSPEQKAEKLSEIRKAGPVLYIGDGLNDAEAFAAADLSAAEGEPGDDELTEAADIALYGRDISRASGLLRIPKKALKAVRTDVILVILIKLALIALCGLGILTMGTAVLADVALTMIVCFHVTGALGKES